MSWVFWGGTDEADHRQFSAFKRGDTAGIISPLHVVVDGEFSRIAFESGPLGRWWTHRAVAVRPDVVAAVVVSADGFSGLGVDSYRGYRRRSRR
jgi:hypothetical protein